MKKIISTSIVALAILLVSCSKDGGLWYSHNWEKDHPNGQSTQSSCDTSGTISYSVTIQPIITQNCATAGCHVSHAQVDYNVFANVVSDAQAAPPNDIITRVKLPSSDPSHMPQTSSSLSACDISKIRIWINQGCLNN